MTKKQAKQMLEDAVARGVQLLDEEWPEWEVSINLNELAMDSACNCVLGQLFKGSYYRGTSTLKISQRGAEFGFDLPVDWPVSPTWNELETIWMRVIRQRQRERDAAKDATSLTAGLAESPSEKGENQWP